MPGAKKALKMSTTMNILIIINDIKGKLGPQEKNHLELEASWQSSRPWTVRVGPPQRQRSCARGRCCLLPASVSSSVGPGSTSFQLRGQPDEHLMAWGPGFQLSLYDLPYNSFYEWRTPLGQG